MEAVGLGYAYQARNLPPTREKPYARTSRTSLRQRRVLALQGIPDGCDTLESPSADDSRESASEVKASGLPFVRGGLLEELAGLPRPPHQATPVAQR